MEPRKRLFWNDEGRVECEAHMPYRGSDTFVFERWRVMTTAERIDFAAEVGYVRCESCAAIERNRTAVTT